MESIIYFNAGFLLFKVSLSYKINKITRNKILNYIHKTHMDTCIFVKIFLNLFMHLFSMTDRPI